MYFTFKKDETSAVKNFQKTCTYHGLDVHLSQSALHSLKLIAEGGEQEITNRQEFTLQRLGLIRTTPDGAMIITELGLLVVALGEAGGLISLKVKKP